MISKFFIHRPKFAFVISIVLTLAGLLSIPMLPVAEFPNIFPPQVLVTTNCPGASAEVVAGPSLATTLVLVAVFVSTAVMPDITGKMYAQFSIAICIAILISSVNALTLSPTLRALLLSTPKNKKNGAYVKFNVASDKVTSKYTSFFSSMVRKTTFVGCIYLVLLGVTAYLFTSLPNRVRLLKIRKLFSFMYNYLMGHQSIEHFLVNIV
ncbi:efflux RND transporter permease subunit [Vibrio sp. McD22-P3]|uniref:efflux RND transporter permease subunit n=1 Tax=Vibrio sp. McD22-P3 TaxID=2724880 RepID=UPI001F3B65BD|nr:efflux RND transporter permease subunit [Vibrio sp. McD22-P3]MCF4176113.1 efflux RND transporter permease subunit [Vibrio sp. McD22-P3]